MKLVLVNCILLLTACSSKTGPSAPLVHVGGSPYERAVADDAWNAARLRWQSRPDVRLPSGKVFRFGERPWGEDRIYHEGRGPIPTGAVGTVVGRTRHVLTTAALEHEWLHQVIGDAGHESVLWGYVD